MKDVEDRLGIDFLVICTEYLCQTTEIGQALIVSVS